MNKGKIILIIFAFLFIFMFIVVKFIRDDDSEETIIEDNNEIIDTTPKGSEDLVRMWYSDKFGSVKVPDIKQLQITNYELRIEEGTENQITVLIRNIDGTETLLANKIESTALLSNFYSSLVDGKWIFFDLRIPSDFDCVALDSITKQDNCKTDVSTYSGIWKFDLEAKQLERIIQFTYKEN